MDGVKVLWSHALKLKMVCVKNPRFRYSHLRTICSHVQLFSLTLLCIMLTRKVRTMKHGYFLSLLFPSEVVTYNWSFSHFLLVLLYIIVTGFVRSQNWNSYTMVIFFHFYFHSVVPSLTLVTVRLQLAFECKNGAICSSGLSFFT